MILLLTLLNVAVFLAMIFFLFRTVFARGRRLEMLGRSFLLLFGWMGTGLALVFVMDPSVDRAQPTQSEKIADEVYEAPKKAPNQSKAENGLDDCDGNKVCIMDTHKLAAQSACNPKIRDMGNYSSRWIDSWTEPRYSKYAVNLEKNNTLTMFGDAIEFQNAFGAWQRVSYVCVYNFETDSVLTVSGQPGRLNL